MRVGVDVRGLTVPIFGIGRYTQCLLDELVKVPDVTWYLYADRPIIHPIDHANVRIRQYESSNRILSLFRTQIQFSRWARQDGLDIFWSPRHHLPLFLPRDMKKVVTIHDLVWMKYPETMMMANRMIESILMPKSLAMADRIISVSNATRTDIVERFPAAAKRVSVIHQAVNRIESQPRPCSNPYFLFVGTLEPRKNLKTQLKAFEKYRDAGGENELLIVGAKGWKQQDIVSENLNDIVHVLGYLSDTELAGLYQQADALMLPSLYEVFGLPALEAMQYGIPVIGSNRGAVPEVIGQGGILIDPMSTEEIADAMMKIATNDQLQHELGELAIQEAAKYNWSRAADETMALLRQVVS